jgi:hypothetical protein
LLVNHFLSFVGDLKRGAALNSRKRYFNSRCRKSHFAIPHKVYLQQRRSNWLRRKR